MVDQVKEFLSGKGLAGGATISFAITALVKAIQDFGAPLNPAQTTLILCILVAILVGVLEQTKNPSEKLMRRSAQYILTVLMLIATFYISASSGTAESDALVDVAPLAEIPTK